jgi:hypothetical protein
MHEVHDVVPDIGVVVYVLNVVQVLKRVQKFYQPFYMKNVGNNDTLQRAPNETCSHDMYRTLDEGTTNRPKCLYTTAKGLALIMFNHVISSYICCKQEELVTCERGLNRNFP